LACCRLPTYFIHTVNVRAEINVLHKFRTTALRISDPVVFLTQLVIIKTFIITINFIMIFIIINMALAQIPISTFSHVWVFVRQYGVMFVIIVIIIIIIIIYRKVKVSTLKHV